MKNLSFFGHSVLVLHIVLGTFSIWPTISSMPWPTLASTRHVPLPPTDYSFTNTTLLVQQQISGVVTDAQGPLPAVTITVKNSNAVAITDVNGHYTIAALPSDILVFSLLGYKTVEIPVGSQEQINATLVEDATALQEVTVNAGYYTVKDKERTGSIATIKAADIEKQPVTNVLATMQGRMAGVDVVQESGMPGGEFQIRIRGINSLRADGNAPLYIIDGVPFSSESIGSQNTSGVFVSMTSPLNAIDPATIESIEVLKDADATAIYGSRGANGVVLLTTKKGKGGKTRFTAEASTAFASVAKFVKLLTTEQYIKMRDQAVLSDGLPEPPFFSYDINGTWDRTRYTDWQKELIGGTAEIRNWKSSVSGGTAQTNFVLSGNYRSETSVMPGDFKFGKGSVHFSANHTSLNDKFKMIFSTGYVAQKNNLPDTDLTATALSLPPNAPALYDENGDLNWEDSTWENPLARLASDYLSRSSNLTAHSVLAYTLLPNLEVKANLGYNELNNNERRAAPSTMFDPAYGLTSSFSSLYVNNTALRSWIIEPQINWKLTIGESTIDALVGSTFQDQRTTRLHQSGFGFATNNLILDLASATNRTVTRSDETIYKYQALFARINYNYNSKYIVNITGRRDGSSRFGPGKQFANFGAIGAGWIFSKEDILGTNSLLSFGKLRSSFGITGNDQIGDYQFLDTYGSTGVNYDGTMGLAPLRLYNPAFGWESNRKFEIALDTGFFNDRLNLSAAYYANRSSDQLVGIPLPATTGFSSLNANLDATVENSGVEFTLRSTNINKENFTWTSNFNISSNRNKLLSFPGLEGSPYANMYVVGQSINIVKLYHYLGINPDTGIYEFEDVDGDGSLSSVGDRTRIANLTPKYYGGLHNQFKYKGFTLDFLLQFAKQKRFEFYMGAPGGRQNQLAGNYTGWQEAGDSSTTQVLTIGFNGDALEAFDRYYMSDAAIVDASFIKLKNASISYDLPLRKSSELTCRLFLNAQNVLTFTKYRGNDPEFKYPGQMPPLRVISTGAQLSF